MLNGEVNVFICNATLAPFPFFDQTFYFLFNWVGGNSTKQSTIEDSIDSEGNYDRETNGGIINAFSLRSHLINDCNDSFIFPNDFAVVDAK